MVVEVILFIFYILISCLILANLDKKSQKIFAFFTFLTFLILNIITLNLHTNYTKVEVYYFLKKLYELHIHTIFGVLSLIFLCITLKLSNANQRCFMLMFIFNSFLYWYILYNSNTSYPLLIFIVPAIIYFFLKLSKKQKAYILLINECFILVFSSIFLTDCIKVQNQEKPVFYLQSLALQDGGTVEYECLGYRIIKYHKIIDDYEYSGYFTGTYICRFQKNENTLFRELFKEYVDNIKENT